MVIDHAGLALFPNIGVFRCIGRIAFPIYCFLLTQGFLHTRSVRAYGRRLLIAALLSEIPFDLLIFGRLSSSMEQNVFFSLLLGLIALSCVHTYKNTPLTAWFMVISLCMGAMITRVSFGWLSIALCLSTYFARQRRMLLCLYTTVPLASIYSASSLPALRKAGYWSLSVLWRLCCQFSCTTVNEVLVRR